MENRKVTLQDEPIQLSSDMQYIDMSSSSGINIKIEICKQFQSPDQIKTCLIKLEQERIHSNMIHQEFMLSCFIFFIFGVMGMFVYRKINKYRSQHATS
jgi:hypothetical protein